MTNKFAGRITYISPIEQKTSKTGKEYKKMEFVITEVEGEYPQSICIGVFGDKCDTVAAHQVGDTATALYNITATLYNGRYYNNINFYRFEDVPTQQPDFTPATAQQQAQQFIQNTMNSNGQLPF